MKTLKYGDKVRVGITCPGDEIFIQYGIKKDTIITCNIEEFEGSTLMCTMWDKGEWEHIEETKETRSFTCE
jgi:hypothetical protein